MGRFLDIALLFFSLQTSCVFGQAAAVRPVYAKPHLQLSMLTSAAGL